jgi:hypothetical protein
MATFRTAGASQQGMEPRATVVITLALGAARLAGAAILVPTTDGRTAIDLSRAAQPPVIDGRLDDPAWAGPALGLPEWISYNPVRGQTIPQTTEVRVSYDDTGIYFAFHCVDPEPDKVRATLSRRDDLWNDDWVGVSLDALGSGQQTYDLFVNPRGVQGDILNTATAGETTAPDWVWDSAGRQTPEGYDVEIRVPWKSIRFASGADVKMGILFWRRVSRIGMSASWPTLPPDKPFFQNHAPMLLKDLRRPLSLEVVPSATFSRSEERVSPKAYGPPDNEPDVGLSVKYGVTSTTSIEATVNPDFSQVESDAYQVEVNQRYPIFYSEKRPFFMEGMGTFQLAGAGGDAVMRTAVHTRRIVDPSWGGKTSGSLGRFTFATLAASDTGPGHDPDADPGVAGHDALFLIGRGTWSLGPSSYVGAIATDTELASGHNRVGGADFTLARGSHTWTGTFLGSQSRTPDGQDRTSGLAGQVFYAYDTKRWTFVSQAEHYDRDFRMDTAFLNQTGITTDWTWAQLSLYPDEKKHPWFKRFSPFVFTRVGRDLVQGGDVLFGLFGVQATFTRQLFVRIDAGWGQEPWRQRGYRTRMLRLMANGQPLRWLSFNLYANRGRSIYYDDEEAPFAGPSWNHSLGVTLQPGPHFSESVSWDRAQLDHPEGGRAYRVDVLNAKTTFQFDRRFALRGIVRYDSSARRVLVDLLGSFEPMPGTVAYVGYGSLYERRGWDGTAWLEGSGDYLTTRRGLFVKASYAKRF